MWRRRQDSNLHRLSPERFSRPRQYQLCLLLHIGGEGGIRTLARFCPANPLAGGPLEPLGYLSKQKYEEWQSKKQTQPSLDVKTLYHRSSFCFYICRNIQKGYVPSSHIRFIYMRRHKYETTRQKTVWVDVGPRSLVFQQIRFANPNDKVFVTVSYPTSGMKPMASLVETIGIEPILGGPCFPLSSQRPIPIWCLEPESNQRHVDFQSTALPTELSRHILDAKEKIEGIEPTTHCLTDNCSTK